MTTPTQNTLPHSRSREGADGVFLPVDPSAPTNTPRDQWIADHMTPTYYPEIDQ